MWVQLQAGSFVHIQCVPELHLSLWWVSDSLPQEDCCQYFHLTVDEIQAQRRTVCQMHWQ